MRSDEKSARVILREGGTRWGGEHGRGEGGTPLAQPPAPPRHRRIPARQQPF